MILENNKFRVWYDAQRETVFLTGTLRLQGRDEYGEVNRLLTGAAETAKGTLRIDLQKLEFLNSSGISALSLFVIEMRKIGKSIRIVGNGAISWQEKSIHNFQRLYGGAEIEIIRTTSG